MSDKTTPVTRSKKVEPSTQRSDGLAIAAFLERARAISSPAAGGKGRLVLALDATMSRQPTWDMACTLQAQMFDAVDRAARLDVQLVYFRGFGECRASRFVADTASLKDLMVKIDCRGGHTQIGKVLSHAIKTNGGEKINALVYIGDAMEEQIDDLAQKAGTLGLHGVPVFMFQEGHDAATEVAFKEIARLSNGAWFRFDRDSAATLAQLLSSIAVYATGGLKALEARGRPEDRLMLSHMRRDGRE